MKKEKGGKEFHKLLLQGKNQDSIHTRVANFEEEASLALRPQFLGLGTQ